MAFGKQICWYWMVQSTRIEASGLGIVILVLVILQFRSVLVF